MSEKVYVFLADGCEEIEALTVVDLLRRAGVDTETISITEEQMIRGAHGIEIKADKLFDCEKCVEGAMLVLPGGMPGTVNLGQHKGLADLLARFHKEGKYLAAICAAPTILAKLGMLERRHAVSYPAKEAELAGAVIGKEEVAMDGHIITSRGLGTAIPFALKLIEVLQGSEAAELIRKSIVYQMSE